MIVSSDAPAIDSLSPPARARRYAEHRALGLLALVAVGVMWWVSRSVAVGMFIGALTAFILQPLYARVLRRVRRPWLAQTMCLSLTTLVVVVIIVGVSAILVARGTVMGTKLLAELQPDGELRRYIHMADAKLAPLHVDLGKVVDQLRDAASSIATYAAGVATAVAGETFHAILTLFFVILTTAFVLARGEELEGAIEDLAPLSRPHTRTLLAEIRKVGKATLLGSVVTGLAQGCFAGLVFWTCGVPEPLFFGVATAVASLLPGVGTMLVWVPAGAYLIATGHVVRGVVELTLAGGLVVGVSDYVLRPRLVGDESMPAVLTFAALFGGVEAFGLVGLLVGPLFMSVAVAVLRLYRDDVLEGALAEESAASQPAPT